MKLAIDRVVVGGERRFEADASGEQINRGGQTDVLRDGTFELRPAKPRLVTCASAVITLAPRGSFLCQDSPSVTRYTSWLKSASTKVVGRLSPTRRRTACIIRVLQCSTKGKKVSTLVDELYCIGGCHSSWESGVLQMPTATAIIVIPAFRREANFSRLEMLQTPRADIRGIPRDPAMHNRQALNSR